MIVQVLEGIHDAVAGVVSDNIPIVYDEYVAQGLIDGGSCVFIQLINVSKDAKLGDIFHQIVAVDVQYFGRESIAQLCILGEAITDAIETITLRDGSVIRGGARQFELVDGVIHIVVSYNMRMMPVIDPVERMGEISLIPITGGVTSG